LRNTTDTVATNYTVPITERLSPRNWYWRVYAVDNLGNVGQYSSARSFQVSVQAGLPIALIVGFAGVVPAVAILSSIVLLRRRRKTEVEAFERKNLIAAYVFSKDGRCMFTHQFKEVKIEPQLLSGFLTAISNMMKEVIDETGRSLRTIERPDAKILLEFGENVNAALATRSASREYRRRLKAFLTGFEHDYDGKISK